MTKLLVTVSPPTPNGDLHIGHLAGPFLSADVFARAQRQRNHDCVLISYSDDYQSYMLRRGLELDSDPMALANSFTEKICESLELVGIDFDNWLKAYRNPYFEAAVREVYDAACEAGLIVGRESLEPYCPGCKVWGYEAFGRGDCNYCGVDSDASQCENCAQEPVAREMKNFRCKLCGKPHQWVGVQRDFLQLERCEPVLRALYERIGMRAPLNDWVADTLANYLKDWGVTRPGDGGLDLLPDGSRRIHTWFMGLAGYLAAFREYTEQIVKTPAMFDDYLRSGNGRLVHFLGFDCVLSHNIVYPSLLSTLKGYKVEQFFYPNQFLKLNGLNLSTSRNHVIWGRDLVRDYESDSVRLYLASIAPEETEGDFISSVFDTWHQRIFGEFLDALFRLPCEPRQYFLAEVHDDDYIVMAGLRQRWLKATSLDKFSMRMLAQVILDTIAMIEQRMLRELPCLSLIALLAVFARPISPNLATKICYAFDIDEQQVTDYLIKGTDKSEYSI